MKEYYERARLQALEWARGNVYHEPINDECAPDFSCCAPDLFINDEGERWRYYHKQFGRLN
jgi:hypothetical protein